MEMHAIQPKQASRSSGCIVGKPYLGITSHSSVNREPLPISALLQIGTYKRRNAKLNTA